MSTIRVVNIQHSDATEPNIVLEADGTAIFASGITISGGTNLTVSGTAEFASGTVSAPGITFIDDNNTGIYEPAADTVAITTAATERLRVDSSGRVGIGDSSPNTNLVVKGASNSLTNSVGNINVISTDSAAINAGGSIGLGGFYNGTSNSIPFANLHGKKENGTGNNAAGYFAISTRNASSGTAERMRIDSSGRLGIGTSSPTRMLEIKNSDNVDTFAGLKITSNNQSAYVHYGWRGLDGSDQLRFATGTTERMRIDSAGRVLLGTTIAGAAAGDNLTIEDSSNAGITIRSSAVGAGSILFEDTASDRGEIQYSHNGDFMRFKTAGTERLRIDSNGKIYIGPYKAPATYGTPAHNIPYKIGVAPYGWQNGSDLAEISMGNHSGSTGNDDGEIMFKTASNVHSSATGLQNRMQITSTGDTLFYGDAVQYAPNAFYIQTHTITSSWTSYQTIATGLSSNTIYLVSINWQHGSSANQPYYYATSFLFHTANGTNGSSGENEKTFLHTTHTGTTSYFMTFRGLATAGGGSTGHKLQAKINSNWPGATSGNNLKLALTKVMNGTRSF